PIGEVGERREPLRLLPREEADERKAIRRKAGPCERRENRGRTGERPDGDALVDGGAHEAETRVADERRAGLGQQRDVLALAQPVDEPRRSCPLVVLVVADDARGDEPE